MNKVIIFLFSFILVGCASNQTIVRDTKINEINISQTLLDCPDKKVNIPSPDKLTDQQVAQYILRLNGLLNECKSDVKTIKKLLEDYNKKVKEFNKK